VVFSDGVIDPVNEGVRMHADPHPGKIIKASCSTQTGERADDNPMIEFHRTDTSTIRL
jgi:hypothetical protein